MPWRRRLVGRMCEWPLCDFCCIEGRINLDGQVENGCEYGCTVGDAEVCNGRDDDCDGRR